MSVFVTSAEKLVELCQRTLAVLSAHPNRGVRGERVARVFRAVHIAQNAAYAGQYGEDLDVPAVEFPTRAPAALLVRKPDLRELYDTLRMVRYNTVDNDGNQWLPVEYGELLDGFITHIAALAAGFDR